LQTKKGLRLLGHSDLAGFGNGGQIVVKRMGKSKYLAFVSHMQGKAFTILDVSEPSKPKIILQKDTYEGTLSHKLRIHKGRYLVLNCEKARDENVTRFDSGFRIFDLKDENEPRELSFTRVEGRGVHRFWISEDLALMPSYVDGFEGRILLMFDISNLSEPRFVSRWWYPGQNTAAGEKPSWTSEGRNYRAHGPPIKVGDRIYLGYWDAGALILDCHDLQNLSIVSQTNLCPPYGGCTHTVLPVSREIGGRKWMIVTDEAMAEHCREGKKLLWIMDATDERHIVPVSTFSVPDDGFCKQGGKFGAHNIHEDDRSLKDGKIYASWYNAGVRVVDISNPYSPKETAFYIPRHDPKKQKSVQTNDLYVDERGLIYTIDRYFAGVHILEKTSKD
jgi:hypothetical protein